MEYSWPNTFSSPWKTIANTGHAKLRKLSDCLSEKCTMLFTLQTATEKNTDNYMTLLNPCYQMKN